MQRYLKILEKLDWPILTTQLAEYAKSEEGILSCANLALLDDTDDIVRSWGDLRDMKRIVSDGYKIPLRELPSLRLLLRAIELGQILNGQELYLIWSLLENTSRLYSFADTLKERYPVLGSFRSNLLPISKLQQQIKETVSESGAILDSASDELRSIRNNKKNMRKRIEDKLTALIHNSDLVSYLQDDFFTLRSDRYVIPMKLDCRGRVKGKIVDTSDSGQTLFFEPTEISGQNEELLGCELQEKLEIARILKALSQKINERHEDLVRNYENVVSLDILSAKAQLAFLQRAEAPCISDNPIIDLHQARHPLLLEKDDRKIIANTITTEENQHILVISGPNAGGKTVVLKTVGLLHIMAKAGLLLPVAPESRIYNFRSIFLEMGDLQSLTTNLSTFSAHLSGLKPIITEAKDFDLVLLDELCVGTEPQTGAALAQSIVETLAENGIKTVITTHFDNLKALASHDKRYRNGSMEYSLKNYRPTFKLLWDIPGQSFGIELAEQLGLPRNLIERARELRGTKFAELDAAISEYLKERDILKDMEATLGSQTLALESTKAHFEAERENLHRERQKLSKKYAEIYEDKLQKLEDEFFEKLEEFKKEQKLLLKNMAVTTTDFTSLNKSHEISGTLGEISKTMRQLAQEGSRAANLPGQKIELKSLSIGDTVWIIPMQKEAQVTKLPQHESDVAELQMGLIKLKSALHDLRFMRQGSVDQKQAKKPSRSPDKKDKGEGSIKEIALTLKTATNSVDVRGLDTEQASDMIVSSIDKALMRGEHIIMIIHGHGTGALKSHIRTLLNNDFPYAISFRSGQPEEGGDGVTVVRLNS